MKKKPKFTTILNFLLIGAAFGWLIGMSSSPVIAIVITGFLEFIILLLLVVSGLKGLDKEKVEAVVEKENDDKKKESSGKSSLTVEFIKTAPNYIIYPVTILFISIAFFGTAGVYFRTSSWYQDYANDQFINYWSNNLKKSCDNRLANYELKKLEKDSINLESFLKIRNTIMAKQALDSVYIELYNANLRLEIAKELYKHQFDVFVGSTAKNPPMLTSKLGKPDKNESTFSFKSKGDRVIKDRVYDDFLQVLNKEENIQKVRWELKKSDQELFILLEHNFRDDGDLKRIIELLCAN
jgi:flagellar biosynthesis protein FliP